MKNTKDLFIFGCTASRSFKIFTKPCFKAFGNFNGSWIEDLKQDKVTEFKEPLEALSRSLKIQADLGLILSVAIGYEFYELFFPVGMPSKADYDFPLYVIYGFEKEHQQPDIIESIYQSTDGTSTTTTEDIRKYSAYSSWSEEEYILAIQKIREEISAGEVYQVNLSQNFKLPLQNSKSKSENIGFNFFSNLATYHPAPYSCYFDIYSKLKGHVGCIVSNSPELFLKKEGNILTTCPIKGTAARGETLDLDLMHKKQLVESSKDLAELAMIVDLERNDLGQISEVGSVTVSEHAALKEYSNVFHLVSKVQGNVLSNFDFIDIFRALFPSGSITGAPKIAARKFIAKMEHSIRNIYTGAIGIILPDGDFEFSVAIRSGVIVNNILYFNAGGGITYNSNPEQEYIETLTKAKAFFHSWINL